eukprot:gene12767-14078_t
MAAKHPVSSLNRISEEQVNGEGQKDLDANGNKEKKKQRKVSQFEVNPSPKLRTLGEKGNFTTTHVDNPALSNSRASNSVTFSFNRRQSSDAVNKFGSSGSYENGETGGFSLRNKATYQLQPARIFNSLQVKAAIKEVFDSVFDDENEASSSTSSSLPKNLLCKNLTEAIKMKTRRLNYDRYKIIVHVFIGVNYNDNLTLKVTSRCVWDEKFDNYAEHMHKTKDFYVLGLVHGIYKE